MVQIRCRMCGGTLRIDEGSHIAVCEYCFTKQTLPILDDEKKERLFERANRLLAQSEFDRSAGIYESIVAQYGQDPEGYWGLVLCQYGIEYVDDPATARKVPTCHRLSYHSVTEDPNYKKAVELADGEARQLYMEQAAELERIRESTITISSSVIPYDIFLCYKETDDQGERTRDSLIAQEIYNELIDLGYKVFYARISLEDRIGQDYEPVIFSALNSARIMLAISTSYDNYDSVWVKNEWSRFLKLAQSDSQKTLIPVYAELDPDFDLPKEFHPLASQDIGQTGAMQDLIYGIQKLLPVEGMDSDESGFSEPNENDVMIRGLMRRAELAIEEKDYKEAEGFYRKIQEIDPEYPPSYLGLIRVITSKDEKKALLEKLREISPEISSSELEMIKKRNARLILQYYIQMEDEGRVRALLGKYPEKINSRIKAKNSDYSILHYAINMEKVSILPVLLELGADPNSERIMTSDAGTYTSSCLQDALLKENEKMVEILLDAGADADKSEKAYNKNGDPIERSKLFLASKNAMSFDCIRNLIRHGADPNAVCFAQETPWGTYKITYIQLAVRRGWLDDVHFLEEEGIVLDLGEEVSFYHENDVTRRPLLSLVAFSCADPEMLLYLLEKGADPRTQRTTITPWGEEKVSCLQDFAHRYKNECVKILLDRGVDANTTTEFCFEDRKEVNSILFEAVAAALDDEDVFKKWNVLRNAFVDNILKMQLEILDKKLELLKNDSSLPDSLDVDEDEDSAGIVSQSRSRESMKETELLGMKLLAKEKKQAAVDGTSGNANRGKEIEPALQLELVKMLLDAGADIRKGSKVNYTGGRRNVSELFYAKGSKSAGGLTNEGGSRSVSILSYAICHCASPELVELLLQAGADPNERITEYNEAGEYIGEWNPLLQAVLCNPQSPPIVELLIKYGASLKDKVQWDGVVPVKVRDYPLYDREIEDEVRLQLKKLGFKDIT